MLQLSICRSLLVVAVLALAAPTCCAAEPPAATQPPAGDELAFVLKKIRAAHDAVFSGEYLAAEVIEQETVEGKQQRVSNELRGVFARVGGQTRRRHEFRRTRKSRSPLDQYLVVESDAATALWTNSGPIYLLPDRHALLRAEQCPIDPLALGFVGPISSMPSTGGPEMWPSCAEFEKSLAAHHAKGHVSVRREPTGYTMTIEIPVLSASGQPLPLEAVSEGAPVTVIRRITIDSNLGFVPTSNSTSFLNKHGKEVGRRPWTIDVTWAKRANVAVPVAVRTDLEHTNVDEERRTITFTWKSVNQPISNDEFDYTKFPAPAGTEILERRQLPAHVIGVIGAPKSE
jgi:hypothetical protein